MKQIIYTTIKISAIIAGFVLFALIIIGIIAFHDTKYKVKTEYGDIFYMSYDSVFIKDVASITNKQHDFYVMINYVDSEKDLTPVCDTDYFRCYRFRNEIDNFYICGLKPDGNYTHITYGRKEAPSWFKEEYSEDFKKVFLADKYIMEITLPYMDDIYHDEFVTMAEKFVSEDFEGLDKYGLTEEMIQDIKSLEEKTKILKEYFSL